VSELPDDLTILQRDDRSSDCRSAANADIPLSCPQPKLKAETRTAPLDFNCVIAIGVHGAGDQRLADEGAATVNKRIKSVLPA
jgi:hypothetical protein